MELQNVAKEANDKLRDLITRLNAMEPERATKIIEQLNKDISAAGGYCGVFKCAGHNHGPQHH